MRLVSTWFGSDRLLSVFGGGCGSGSYFPEGISEVGGEFSPFTISSVVVRGFVGFLMISFVGCVSRACMVVLLVLLFLLLRKIVHFVFVVARS
jgi:hypothetical protein